MSTRKSKRLQKKKQRTINFKLELPPVLFVKDEDDEEIELGSEDTTSSGETDVSETDSSSDYEPEPDETLSNDENERQQEALNKMLQADKEKTQKKM